MAEHLIVATLEDSIGKQTSHKEIYFIKLRGMRNLRAILLALFASAIALQVCSVHATLSASTEFYWGAERGRYTGPDSVDLVLDKTGGTGIKSKAGYMYGSITMGIKLPAGNSAGTVTTFYLSSTGDKHNEIDFEFLGNVSGQPFKLHTNIFTRGFGKREEQFFPWFDPTDGYHYYTIFWGPYQVVWFVDGKPIRVFKNYNDTDINFPDNVPMDTYASFWNADDWATQGGRVKTDWSLAPFKASLKNYVANACHCYDKTNYQPCVQRCSAKSPENWWTNDKYKTLTAEQKQQMKMIRDKYMVYSYCKDTKRFNGALPEECYKS